MCKEDGAAKEDLCARVPRVVGRLMTLVESGDMRPFRQHTTVKLPGVEHDTSEDTPEIFT